MNLELCFCSCLKQSAEELWSTNENKLRDNMIINYLNPRPGPTMWIQKWTGLRTRVQTWPWKCHKSGHLWSKLTPLRCIQTVLYRILFVVAVIYCPAAAALQSAGAPSPWSLVVVITPSLSYSCGPILWCHSKNDAAAAQIKCISSFAEDVT